MLRLLLRWFLTALAIVVLPEMISGIRVDDFAAALAAAALLSVLNVLVRPILVFLTFPFTIISLGFFLLIINAFVLQMVGLFVRGFHIDSFASAFLGALLVSLASWITHFAVDSSGGKTKIVIYKTESDSKRRSRDVTPS